MNRKAKAWCTVALVALTLAACSSVKLDEEKAAGGAPIESREGSAISATTAPLGRGPVVAAEPVGRSAVAPVEAPPSAPGALSAAGASPGGGVAGGGQAGTSAQSQGQGQAQAEAAALKALSDPSSPVFRKIIYFDFDSFEIREEFRGLVQSHATFLKANRQFKVAIQGHTDERGTREYNLALGQKRAEAVRKALTSLGVADAQLEAVSFGEEKPMNPGNDETAYGQNRRAELAYPLL
jgi:peptidoglycan-associated lipoprotein